MMVSDISWLPLSDRKNMPDVVIKYEDYNGQNYGGYYDSESKTIAIVQNKEWSINHTPSTIAHEYRHHIQKTLNKYCVPNIPVEPDIFTNYNSAIRRFFRKSVSELDALIYQNKLVKSEITEYWLKALVLPSSEVFSNQL